jgi:hypothetical protein
MLAAIKERNKKHFILCLRNESWCSFGFGTCMYRSEVYEALFSIFSVYVFLFLCHILLWWNRDSLVVQCWGSSPGRGWEFFSSPPRPDRLWGPPSLPGALSLGVKRLESEADHSTSSSAEDKNAWSYTSTPQYAFMAWCSVKLYYCGRGEGTYKNVSW